MKWVVDNQLSLLLAAHMRRRGHECVHVIDVGLDAADDVDVWAYGQREGAIVISKDEDFVALSARPGDAGRLLWVRLGNLETWRCLRRSIGFMTASWRRSTRVSESLRFADVGAGCVQEKFEKRRPCPLDSARGASLTGKGGARVLARIQSFMLVGIDAQSCEVEVDVNQRGMDKTTIVGLAQTAVKESVERIRRAIVNSGLPFPGHGLVINLAPADVKKEGPALDLAMAVGVLRGTNFIQSDVHKKYLVAGELALDGRVRKIKGGLSMALLARDRKMAGVILPAENAREAAVVDDIEVIAVSSLSQAVSFLNEQLPLEPYQLNGEPYTASALSGERDFADVRGQEAVKRAITVACAGSHNLLMVGPPGTGKTMLAQRIPSILPPLSRGESLETTRIYSAMGLLPEGVALMDERPVRTPHHSATAQALVGGGTVPRPGECSLAHNGVLFLDELPEFSRYVLEMLRQPLEGGEVCVARVHGSIRFPARFMLVAAMNPSASGYGKQDGKRDKYLEKLSGPLLDRIDIHVEVPAVPYRELTGKQKGTDSSRMREHVQRARGVQAKRFGEQTTNGAMSSRQMKEHCELSEACLLLMKQAMEELGLSARAYDKVRRVARTIADLEGAKEIGEAHLAEAVQYRLLDRRF